MRKQTIKELRNFARRRSFHTRGYSYDVEKDALIRAAIDGMDLKEAKELVKAGADVNAENGDGNTPLYFAVTDCKPDVVEFLIKQGADVNHLNNKGETPLFPATSSFFGKKANAEILLDAGADPTVINKEGCNVLTDGCNPNIALMLIENGVDVNTQDGNGMTILFEAAGRTYSGGNFVEILINAGANIEVKNKWGATPLFYTVRDNTFENAWVFLDNGANIDAQDNEGKTTLITAVECGLLSFTRLLLECGADASIRSKDGTALEIAEAKGHTKVASLLRSFEENKEKGRHFRR